MRVHEYILYIQRVEIVREKEEKERKQRKKSGKQGGIHVTIIHRKQGCFLNVRLILQRYKLF